MSEEHVICPNCMRSIQGCLDFKSTYLNTEGIIVSLYNSESNLNLDTKLDLKEVYIERKRHMSITDIAEDEQICRFCMKLCKSSSCRPFVKIEEDMIKECIPELNFNLTKEPVICNTCLNSLKFYSQFMQSCADTEEKIIKYCKYEATGSEGPINLNWVIQFTKNVTEYDKDITRPSIGYLDESCDNENMIIKTEAIVEEESAQLNIENVENGIKTDVEEDITKIEIKAEPLEQQNMELETTHDQDDLQEGEQMNEYCKLERNITNGSVVYLDELCRDTNESNNIKIEVIINKGSANVEICIKTDVGEGITYKEVIAEPLKPHNEVLEMINEQNDLQTEHHRVGSFQDASSQMIMKNRNTKVHKCESCSYATKRKWDLKKHMLTHQDLSEVKLYRCDRCSYAGKRKGGLNHHMLTHRELSEVTLYRCDRCSYVGKRKSDLKKHMLTHRDFSEVTVYRCDRCSYGVKQKCSLKTHMLTHQDLSEVKLYRCDICSYAGKQKGALNHHMLTHRELSEVTLYRCDRCSYVGKRKSDLKKHLVTHQDFSEVTLYRCHNCPYVTKRKECLKSHVSIHQDLSEITAYRCDICSYVARQKGSLKKHMLNHHEFRKVYKCHSCSYTTKQKEHFEAHMLIHQNLSKAGISNVDAVQS